MTKIEQLYSQWQALQPITDVARQRLSRKFMLEFNYNSNHIEGNTLTYGQTEILLLFGRVVSAANMKDLEDMKASNVGLNMMQEEARSEYPLTETFIRQLHKTILREDYEEYRTRGNHHYHYTVHAGIYKTRPNSVITRTGDRFNYASPEETPALMTDLVQWYQEAEQSGRYTLPELCALFHYRYIRIHPFEDGNGRIARLLVNFILHRHGYPMIVVKTADKENYLNALSDCDGFIGTEPSDGAYAEISQIGPFVAYIEKCMVESLETCIKAAKGEIIEEDDDIKKQLLTIQRDKRQADAEIGALPVKSIKEVKNVMDFVFLPLAAEMASIAETTHSVFVFEEKQTDILLSPTRNRNEGERLQLDDPITVTSVPSAQLQQAESAWFVCKLTSPQAPRRKGVTIERFFYIAFFNDHYFVDGILNKNFPYGTYPTEEEKREIVSQFKQDILAELKEKL